MKMIFYSHANETHFHKKDFSLFPLGRFLKITVFGTQKWQGSFLRNLFAHDTNGWSLEMSTSVKKKWKVIFLRGNRQWHKAFLGTNLAFVMPVFKTSRRKTGRFKSVNTWALLPSGLVIGVRTSLLISPPLWHFGQKEVWNFHTMMNLKYSPYFKINF